MSIYAVIDTNVIVSVLLSRHSDSIAVPLIRRMLQLDLIPVFSSETMREYAEVLGRRKFKFSHEQISYILSAMARYGLMLESYPSGEILPDMKDLPFYEVVMEKRKTDESYLVTGNQKHFPGLPFIVSPKEMLDILDGKQASL